MSTNKPFSIFNFQLLILLLLTFITFYNSLSNGFLSWDDKQYIYQNDLIKSLSFDNIRLIFSTYVMGNYHPLVVLSDAIIYSIFGLNPVAFHTFSLLLHLINVILVFVFISALCNQIFKPGTKNLTLITLATALFALHPMRSENICRAADLKDVLFTLFFLAAMIYYVRYLNLSIKQPKKNSNQKPPLLSPQLSALIVVYAFFILSLLSKSSAVTLPVGFLLLDYFFNGKINIQDFIKKIPLFLLSLVFGIINIFSQQQFKALSISHKMNISDRFFIISYNLYHYLVLFIVPYNLSAIHPFPVKYKIIQLPVIYYLSPLFIIIIAGIMIWVILKNTDLKKPLIFGFMFFLITMSLTIQIIPIGNTVVSERYTYLPYIGLAFILVYLYEKFRSFYQNFQFSIFNFQLHSVNSFNPAFCFYDLQS